MKRFARKFSDFDQVGKFPRKANWYTFNEYKLMFNIFLIEIPTR